MKKIFFPILLMLCLTACKEDLTDYFTRLDLREKANDSLRKENSALEEQIEAQRRYNEALAEMNSRVKLESDELQRKLDSLEATLVHVVQPKLLNIEFVTNENPSLPKNVSCKIIGDSVIDCWLPMITVEKYLIPRFTFDGTLVTINEMEAESGKSMFDFKAPAKVTVHTSQETKKYIMYVHSFTGLPLMRINTAGGVPITSKEYYVNAHMSLSEDVQTRAPGDVLEADLQIKGRGNSTWHRWPKKPYRLKLDKKEPLMGMPKNRHFVLLAHYDDFLARMKNTTPKEISIQNNNPLSGTSNDITYCL